MEIVWDERKRLANFTKHGLDFADLTLEFRFGQDWQYKAQPAHCDWRARRRHRNRIFVKLGSQGLAVISMRAASAEERLVLL